MKRNAILFTTILMIGALSLTSCNKDDEQVSTDNLLLGYYVEDDEISSFFDEVISETDELTLLAESKSDGIICAADSSSNGYRMRKTYRLGNKCIDTITYQNYVNSKSKFKRIKNGTIIIEKTGGPLQDTFNRKISFKNYTVNDNLIEGTTNITKTKAYTYTITLQNGKVTFKDGTTYTRTFTHTRTWIAGNDTPFNVWDDEYTVEGSGEGMNRKNYSYRYKIKNALRLKVTCRYIVSGNIEYSVDNNTMNIDYGDDTCDQKITVTMNGKANQIQLKTDK